MPLFELRDRVLMLPKLEEKSAFLQNEIKRAEQEVSNLLCQCKKESRDVDQIKEKGFSSFLFKLIGKYEDKLEKEQREEINAKLDYDRAVTRLDSLIQSQNELDSRISSLRTEEKSYQVELQNRRSKLAGKLTEPEGIRYAELGKERNHIVSQITEIEEALRAAARAKSTAEQVFNSFDSAKSWATFDLLSRGGIISHIAKYSHIDDAEEKFHILSSQLNDLKSELKDIHGLNISGLSEISPTQRTIDFWFDNIFTDWSVHSQIKDNLEQIRHLLGKINTVESTLQLKLAELEKELEKSKHDEEEILLSIG